MTNGPAILDECRAFIGRFSAMPSAAALDITTLWCAASHVVDNQDRLAFDTTPRLGFLSDQPASGKTRALEMVGLLCHNGNMTVDPTPASFALMVAEKRATVLIDEIDILFGAGNAKSVLRSLLNSGYRRRGAIWTRANKDDLNIFGAVAFAGLGAKFRTAAPLSPLRSRSILIEMVPTTAPESYRPRFHDRTADMLRSGLSDWAKRNAYRITEAVPDLPEGISDRKAELAEPLLAVADVAGGHWPETARIACRELLLGQQDESDALSLTGQLLRDLRLIFGTADRMATEQLMDELFTLPGSPWIDLWPQDSTGPRELAALLAPLGVGPVKVRLGERSVRGYLATDLAPFWADPVPDAPDVPEASDAA